MKEEVFIQVSEYVFGGLFVMLLIYVLHTSKKREDQLMQHNERLQKAFQETTETMKLMKNELCKEMAAIKELLRDKKNRMG